MKTYHLQGWNDFVRHTDQLEDWAFRGQALADWTLVSSLTRRLRAFCPDERLWRLREGRAIRVFRRKAHIHLREQVSMADDLRCLALMQHHGAATRLMDFTKSPFVAAFFALESATGDAAVYALDTPALWNAAPRFDASLTQRCIDPRVAGNFERYFAANRLPVLWFGEPLEMDRRLTAQAGLFVVPGVLDQPLEAILGGYGRSDDLLQRLVLPASMRQEAMRALYRMNITYATLLPDLDGLARSVGYELEAIWPRLVDDFEQGDPGALTPGPD
jgi:hypothetical protein